MKTVIKESVLRNYIKKYLTEELFNPDNDKHERNRWVNQWDTQPEAINHDINMCTTFIIYNFADPNIYDEVCEMVTSQESYDKAIDGVPNKYKVDYHINPDTMEVEGTGEYTKEFWGTDAPEIMFSDWDGEKVYVVINQSKGQEPEAFALQMKCKFMDPIYSIKTAGFSQKKLDSGEYVVGKGKYEGSLVRISPNFGGRSKKHPAAFDIQGPIVGNPCNVLPEQVAQDFMEEFSNQTTANDNEILQYKYDKIIKTCKNLGGFRDKSVKFPEFEFHWDKLQGVQAANEAKRIAEAYGATCDKIYVDQQDVNRETTHTVVTTKDGEQIDATPDPSSITITHATLHGTVANSLQPMNENKKQTIKLSELHKLIKESILNNL